MGHFTRYHSIQTRMLAGFAMMLLLQVGVSAAIWWATNAADVASAASSAADKSISVVGAALSRLDETQLRLADFLRSGDAVDRVRLLSAIANLDGSIKAAVIEGGTQSKLNQAAPKIRSRLDTAVDAATARREALASIVAIVSLYQNALVAISITGSQAPDRAIADATAVAVTASFQPLSATSRYMIDEDPTDEVNARTGLDTLRSDLEAILVSAPDVLPRLNRLVQVALGQIDRLTPALTELHRTIDARAQSLTDLQASVMQVTESLRDDMQVSKTEQDGRIQAMRLARANVRVSLVYSGALGLLLGGSIAVVIGLSITRPLGRLCDAMGRLAAGTLNITIPDYTRRDEVGRMAQAMEVFKKSMQRNVELKAAEDRLLTANAELVELARVDALTGLGNRRCFDETLAAELLHCARERMPLSLIMIDVDRFKVYNDTYGHQAGDVCLQRLSRVIGAAARRPLDLAARYGGEELAVLLPDADNASASIIAERIRLAIRDLRIEHRGNKDGLVTASFGVSTVYPARSQAMPKDMVSSADRLLYAAKAEGRDRVVAEPFDVDGAVAASRVMGTDTSAD
jgi:diguanylate cyclase (GGDEF)-like protein